MNRRQAIEAAVLVLAVVAVLFAWLALQLAGTDSDLSFIRDTGLHLGLFFYPWAVTMVAASSKCE